jgi:hypothetical protein
MYKVLCLALFVLLLFVGGASAADLQDLDINQTIADYSIDDSLESSDIGDNLKSDSDDEFVSESDDIEVEDWDELQYYCSLTDRDYVLKLKANTNYYPTDSSDSNYQIVVNNNVKIIGNDGAYIGDSSPNPTKIAYTAIKVNDNSGIGITLENVTFKWIATSYQPDGTFLQMGGNSNNSFRNCYFTEISTLMGHSSILHIKIGHAALTNCTFVNCTTDFGCLSIYNPNDIPIETCTGASMELTDCYFEGNYARTEPGCINNCGVLVVNNSTFYRNSAFWWAGAIHTHGGANTTLYNTDFIDNVAGWNGGALYTYSYLQIYNCRFIGNNCTTNNGGGAIGACRYQHSPYIHIEDSLFMNNENLCWGLDEQSTTGTGRGGAISLMDSGGLEVYNSVFIQNSASIGTAICAINGGLSQGSPDIKIIGNRFINHTRIGDVLDVRVATGSIAEIRDNYFLNNSIVFTKIKLTADNPTSSGSVTFHIDVALKNPNSYDSDILDKSLYDVYVEGSYMTTVSGRDFTLNLEKGKIVPVYVVPSISNSKSNEVLAGMVKTYVYVGCDGADDNDGLSRNSPVKTLKKAIEIANSTGIEDIVIMNGVFSENNLVIDFNLTITAENNASISGVTGYVFKVTDGDVKFENLIFRNCQYGSSTLSRIIEQTSSGFLILDGCVFEDNNYRCLIDASGSVEAENLVFNRNTAGLLWADSIMIRSSTFRENVANVNSNKDTLLKYKTKSLKFEADNLTFLNNNVLKGCIDLKGSATITNSNFINNYMSASSSQRSTGIYIESGSVLVHSSKFINNTDKGDAAVIYNSGSALIRDSIFINNSYENDKGIISGTNSGLKAIIANNNWWGNTPENLTKPHLYVISSSVSSGWDPAKYWLVLNVTSLDNEIEIGKMVPVQFIFTQINNTGNVSGYDGFSLPSFDLVLNAINGTCSDSTLTVTNGMATTYFTLQQKSSASLSGSFNGITTTFYFEFKKSTPEMVIDVNDIYVGENATVTVDFDSNITGDVIVRIANATWCKTVSNSKATFTIPDLAAGIYVLELNYTGDELHNSVIKNVTLTVNKHISTTALSVGEMELGEDVIFTITISNGATGTVDVYVNGEKETIGVGESYTIKNIARGDYIIRSVYSGDDYYLGSEDEYVFEIGKLIPKISLYAADIVYGEDAVVNVTLNDNATGSVTVNIDGKTASATLIDGMASVNFSNVVAGNNKQVTVFYSGDHNYKNSTCNGSFNVAKADLNFTIISNNIKLGQEAKIVIQLPARAGGTLTVRGIRDEVKNVPSSGTITLTYDDLGIGNYTVIAEYNGNNYKTVSKSIAFEVSDWDAPQWANEAGDIKHTGKSSYGSDVNGEIKWICLTEEIAGNLAIDSHGDVYVTTVNGIYSFNQNGELRWTFISTAAGDYFSGISISRDVVISPKASDTLYFINQTTGERYSNANLYQGSSYFAPVIDSNGTIYISGQGDANNPNLIIIPYGIWTGGTPTEIPLGSSPVASPTLMDNNLICVPCSDGLKIIDLLSKSIISSISGSISKGNAVVGDGNIIYTFLGDSIVAISDSGAKLWTQKVTGGVGDMLVLDSEQGLYSVNTQGELYKYDILYDGAESRFADVTVTSGILIGNDGILYFASDDVFYAMNHEGNVLWKANLGCRITGTPVMDRNGTIYANGLNKVYAIKRADLKDANITISSQTINVGGTEEITIALNENATGFVTIDINGNESQEEIINGIIIKTVSGLSAGNYTVTVSYHGDSRYSPSSRSDSFEVLKNNPGMAVNVNNIRYGENAVFNITLANDATGNVTVSVNNKNASSEVKNGQTTISVSGLTKGDYEYVVTYSGDDVYALKVFSGQISVDKSEFTFDVELNDTYHVGDSVEFIVTSFPSGASGKVNVTIGNAYEYSFVSNGLVRVVFNGLKTGNYTAIVSYIDDANYMANSKTVVFKVVKTDVSINVDVNDIYVDENATFAISGLPEDAVGVVVVNVDGKSVSANLTNGEVRINVIGLAAGSKNATITFAGDDKYNSKSVARQFKISKIDPRLGTDDITNVHVYEILEFNAYSDASGNITVTENGNPLGSAVLANGVACIRIINGFAYGNHTILIQYSGNYKYLPKNITKTFFADKFYPNLKVVNYTSNIRNITFEIELPSGVTGEISVILNNITHQFSANSKYIMVLNDGAGNYTAKIIYSGDSKYHSDSLTLDVSVNKTFSKINVSVEDISVGDPAIFNITLNPDASGTVEVSVEGIQNSSAVINGNAIVIINGLESGSKNARITYLGDGNYKTSVVDRQFSVNKVVPTVDIKAYNINVGDLAIFDITLNPDATGNVIVHVDGKSNSTSLTEGKARITVVGLTSGIKVATVEYMGDGKYIYGNASCNISVDKMDSPITVSIEDIDYNSNAVANIILPNGAGGEVRLTIGDANFTRNIVVSNISITIPNLEAGEYTAEVIYSGDDNYMRNSTSYTFRVNKIKPVMNLIAKSNVKYGDDVNLTVGMPKANGYITVFIDSTQIYHDYLNKTNVVLLSDLSVGKHIINVTYSGDNNYLESSANTEITVKKEIPDENKEFTLNIPKGTTTAEFTVSLPSDAGGTFTVYVNGTAYSHEVVNGAATVKAENLKVGNYHVYTQYSGDDAYYGFRTENTTINVPKATVPGGKGSFTLNYPTYSIKLPSDATGSLIVTVDGKIRYSKALSKGSATLTIDKLASGEHNVVIKYSGDEKYSGISTSDSVTVKQVAKAATKLTASKKTFKVKTKVKKYSVTLKTTAGKAVKKVKVTLKVNGKTYTAKTNSKGKATFKITKLTKKGKYTAAIKFNGNKSYKSATKKVKITVKK